MRGPRPGVFLALAAICSVNAVTAACSGSPSTPSTTAPPATFLSLVSSPGDQIGDGFTQRVDLQEAVFGVELYPISSNRQTLAITVAPKEWKENWWWTLWLTGPSGEPLRPGTYENARRWPGVVTQPAMDFSGSGRGCSALTGRFVIHELTLGASDGYYTQVNRLHVTFEQRCERAPAAIRGEVSIVANPWR